LKSRRSRANVALRCSVIRGPAQPIEISGLARRSSPRFVGWPRGDRSASVQMRSSSYAFARKLGLSYRCLAPSHPRRRLHWHSRRVRSEQGNAARWRYMKGCFLLAPANANTQRGDPCPHGTEHVFAQKLAGAACITSTVMRLLERSASVQMRSSSYVFARKLGLSY